MGSEAEHVPLPSKSPPCVTFKEPPADSAVELSSVNQKQRRLSGPPAGVNGRGSSPSSSSASSSPSPYEAEAVANGKSGPNHVATGQQAPPPPVSEADGNGNMGTGGNHAHQQQHNHRNRRGRHRRNVSDSSLMNAGPAGGGNGYSHHYHQQHHHQQQHHPAGATRYRPDGGPNMGPVPPRSPGAMYPSHPQPMYGAPAPLPPAGTVGGPLPPHVSPHMGAIPQARHRRNMSEPPAPLYYLPWAGRPLPTNGPTSPASPYGPPRHFFGGPPGDPSAQAAGAMPTPPLGAGAAPLYHMTTPPHPTAMAPPPPKIGLTASVQFSSNRLYQQQPASPHRAGPLQGPAPGYSRGPMMSVPAGSPPSPQWIQGPAPPPPLQMTNGWAGQHPMHQRTVSYSGPPSEMPVTTRGVYPIRRIASEPFMAAMPFGFVCAEDGVVSGADPELFHRVAPESSLLFGILQQERQSLETRTACAHRYSSFAYSSSSSSGAAAAVAGIAPEEATVVEAPEEEEQDLAGDGDGEEATKLTGNAEKGEQDTNDDDTSTVAEVLAEDECDDEDDDDDDNITTVAEEDEEEQVLDDDDEGSVEDEGVGEREEEGPAEGKDVAAVSTAIGAVGIAEGVAAHQSSGAAPPTRIEPKESDPQTAGPAS